MISRYEYVFYIGDKKQDLPDSFLKDIAKNREITVVWIRWNIEELLRRYSHLYPFKVFPERSDFKWLSYGGETYIREDLEEVPIIEVADWDKVETTGVLKSDKSHTPFAVHAGNLWYFPDAPFEGMPYLVFADILHDVFDEPHQVDHRFYVRLEDIHPLRDPGKLRSICRKLHKLKIPFSMGIIPQYWKPEADKPVKLKDKPYLINALKECASCGGSFIMHGYTHQWKKETGEGHEFWDVPNDQPIFEYTESTIREKMRRGIRELAELGIYPIAWETPHYAASEMNYKIISQYFSTAVEQRQVSNRTYEKTQTFPYIARDVYGQLIIPENLGYINLETGETIEQKVQWALPYLSIRDSIVGVFYHPYFKPEYLIELIGKLKHLGFEPFDLKDVPSVVIGENIAFFSGLAEPTQFQSAETVIQLGDNPRVVQINLDKKWLRTFLVDDRYRIYQEKWAKKTTGEQALVTIPDKPGNLFVVETTDHRPTQVERLKKLLIRFVMGDTNSLLQTLQRFILWFFLIVTAIIFGISLGIFIRRTRFYRNRFPKE